MKRIFISDLHLDQSQTILRDALKQFLETHCSDVDELYILGDLFEAWIGDDDPREHSRAIVGLLSSLTCKLFIMHGNRDFLIGDQFCQETGAELLEDPSLISIGNENVLLSHGDAFCTLDLNYQKLRPILRSNEFQRDFLRKELKEREFISQQMRGESKKHTGKVDEEIMDVSPESVILEMEHNNARRLIHGHTHRPAIHQHHLKNGVGLRYVLGDWRPSTTFLVTDGTSYELKKFDFLA
tara:strand:- start:43 stop:762 length:720 start_codon:yes stop_codon:yes gene_type:complete